MDKHSPSQRHYCMYSVRSKDTKPEMVVRFAICGGMGSAVGLTIHGCLGNLIS